MKWLQARTLEELKTCGSFSEVRQRVKNSLGERLGLKARSWKELLEAVQSFQRLVCDQSGQLTREYDRKSSLDEASLYFKSEAVRIIYALVELDGEQRLRELGVDKSYYRDLGKAKKWRNKLAKVIHPDACKHAKAALATNKLTEIFQNMTGK